MYVYYIVMKIYVFICTNIFSCFYFLCIINVTHQFSTIDFTHTNYAKIFQNKIINAFTILFHKTLYSYNNLFVSSESVSKSHKHSFIYLPKKIK
jgi:hypothetical protein